MATDTDFRRDYCLSMVGFAMTRARQNLRNCRLDSGPDKAEYRRLRQVEMQAARYWRDLATQN